MAHPCPSLQSPRAVSRSRSGLLKCFVQRESGRQGFTLWLGKDPSPRRRSRFLLSAARLGQGRYAIGTERRWQDAASRCPLVSLRGGLLGMRYRLVWPGEEGAGDESAVRYQTSGLKGFPRPRVLCADLPAAQVTMDFLEIDEASRQRELAGQISREGLLRQSLESWSSAGSVFVDPEPEAVKTEARGWWSRLPRPAWWDEGVDEARGQAPPALTNSTRSGEVSLASSWVRRQRLAVLSIHAASDWQLGACMCCRVMPTSGPPSLTSSRLTPPDAGHA